MPARRQHHCGPPGAIHAFYHGDWLPACEVTDQLDMMSAVGQEPKRLFFMDRRCHLNQFVCSILA